ncbi:Putative Zn2 transporter MSC2 (cation diffusion facilitator superfamily) [Ceraceosorus bombacis]|uniref:Putative Zn2 transporter MSC2 (Cation diffusion facilitator superfamily) n=1 Tax=Ceraceosorus bombacis TaxID=401625 RepID=A0A0N7LB07_9BASI|nr:Putative Zn2 transporter MSC2 (cation diffusion facilitator superfamily) [Ceraceosorus bombacis]
MPASSSPSSPAVEIDDAQQGVLDVVPSTSPSTSPAKSDTSFTSKAGAAASGQKKKHKSVRSLTREYEETSSPVSSSSERGPSISSTLFPPASEEGQDVARPDLSGRRASNSSSGSTKGQQSGSTHARAPSVLLASGSYPSTLSPASETSPNRPRTISGSSLSAEQLRNTNKALGIASAGYPSSYSRERKSSSTFEGSPERKAVPLPETASGAGAALERHDMERETSSESKGGLPALRVSVQPATPSLNGFPEGEQARATEAAKASRVAEEQEEAYESLDAFPSDATLPLDRRSSSASSELTSGGLSQSALDRMSPAERREHSRMHSTVHARNLSTFFPRPGTEAEAEADAAQAARNFSGAAPADTTEATLAPASADGGANLQSSSSRSRRGHHRKHSVNHAAMLDARGGLQTHSLGSSPSEVSAGGMSSASPLSPVSAATGKYGSDVPPWEVNAPSSLDNSGPRHAPHAAATAFGSSSSSSSLADLSGLPPSARPLLLFGAVHFGIGAGLWVAGQAGDSLAMTGLGYLVVFDALGSWCEAGGQWATTKAKAENKAGKVYGPQRVETLLHFVQSIYLVFASIYVLKESIEHALLEGSEEVHAEDNAGLHLPSGLLLAASAAGLISSMVLGNHQGLVAACGISTAAADSQSGRAVRSRRGHARKASVLVDPATLAGPFLSLLSNPFSLTILFFSLVLTLASIVMPPFQVAALDKVLAGLESAAMIYIAYPASKALGKVLLQTAPEKWQTQSVQLMHTLKTIEEHPLVTYVAPPHLWQLTPKTSALSGPQGQVPSILSGGAAVQQTGPRSAKAASLIANVQVFLHKEATDSDVLNVTRWAWQLAAPALGAGTGASAGESLRGSLRAGELP